jgi:hypothetical protein
VRVPEARERTSNILICRDGAFLYNRTTCIQPREGPPIMKIVAQQVTLDELRCMATGTFGNMVKAVVDVDRELLAVDGELHSDLEALLLEDGSLQESLWGINLYPEFQDEQFVEFDSMINMRPSQGNRSRGIDSPETRAAILRVLEKRIQR